MKTKQIFFYDLSTIKWESNIRGLFGKSSSKLKVHTSDKDYMLDWTSDSLLNFLIDSLCISYIWY